MKLSPTKAAVTALSMALLFALPVLTAFGHTTLANASPKSGSVLEKSPPVIEMQFRDAARLTSVVAIGTDKRERRLEFKPSDKINTFNLLEPKLDAGRNEIQWKALSKDGHVIHGMLIFTIKPATRTP